jgi:hypothetical protein
MRRASLILLVLAAATPAMARKKPPPPAAAAIPAPPPPSVRNGVELWRNGDYAAAVALWQPFAAAGDPDAMFNIGQAYKLGRALPKDEAQARDWFRRAAIKGHRPAQANLGILLFQAGDKAEAVRWLRAAADQNEMRAQYVLGVAYWNGDGAPRSLSLAFAYLTRAAVLGLPEATAALAALTTRASPTERADGGTVAASLAAGKGVPPAFDTRPPITAPVALAVVDRPEVPVAAAPPVITSPRPAPVVTAAAAPPPVVATPKPVPALPEPEAIAAATAPAAIATGAFAVAKPVEVRAERPKKPVWRVQLGAYSKRVLAEAAWKKVQEKQKKVVAGIKPIYQANAGVTKLQLGPYANEKLARDACAKLAFSGNECFVTSG